MPMNWSLKGTKICRHPHEHSFWKMWYKIGHVITSYLYYVKGGKDYDKRGFGDDVVVLTEEDVENVKKDLREKIIKYEELPEEQKKNLNRLVEEIIGLRVWATR